MDGEGEPSLARPTEVAYWLQVYTEILEMEEKVLRRVQDLMATQSAATQREVELTNLPVIQSQVDRFRQRLGYWQARRLVLDGDGSPEVKPRVPLKVKQDGKAARPKRRSA